MNAEDNHDWERMLALYRSCCAQSGVEPLDDDDARDQARQLMRLLAPAFEREFRRH